MNKLAFYLPEEDTIKEMEKLKNVNIYKYIVAKTVEKLLTNNIYLSNINPSLKEIDELVDSICYIYPEELRYSVKSQESLWLCKKIFEKDNNKAIYNLDNLSYFSNSVQNDYNLLIRTIDKLHELLPNNPEYRFCYKQSKPLDSIFLLNSEYFNKYSDDTIKKLIEIEPAYNMVLSNNTVIPDNIRLATSIDEYTNRYGIPYQIGREYMGKSIFDNKDKKVKTLIKNLYD